MSPAVQQSISYLIFHMFFSQASHFTADEELPFQDTLAAPHRSGESRQPWTQPKKSSENVPYAGKYQQVAELLLWLMLHLTWWLRDGMPHVFSQVEIRHFSCCFILHWHSPTPTFFLFLVCGLVPFFFFFFFTVAL